MSENNPTPWSVRAEGGVYMVLDANNDVVKSGLKKAEALAMVNADADKPPPLPPLIGIEIPPKTVEVGPETTAASAEATDATTLDRPTMPSKGRRRGRSK